ncbi:unnamed protein product, partial [Effrenium voratum]
VNIQGSALQIKPYGNDQKWVVTSTLQSENCSAMIDFNVPGKPGPPPVKLLMTFWRASANAAEGGVQKASFEFTDPSGTLAAPSVPLNAWLQLGGQRATVPLCPASLKATFADMHDGDRKAITVAGSEMTITSTNSSQTWVIHAELDEHCSASVNFNVPGKPGPPPVPLAARLWRLENGRGGSKSSFEFTDPSGTLAVPGFPLNSWIQLRSQALDESAGFGDQGGDRLSSATGVGALGSGPIFGARNLVGPPRPPDLRGSTAPRQLATRLAQNLAFGQPVVLSSNATCGASGYTSQDGFSTWTGDGFRATDGDFGVEFFWGASCAETKARDEKRRVEKEAEPNPWARVDLGREVPVAVVRIMTRVDSADTGLGPMDIRLGNSILTWRENLVCAEAVTLSRQQQPNMFNCLASGRYLWLVLRLSGTQVAPFSICEVEVTPKGPDGNRHVLQTAGGMWNLQLTGVALTQHDRIRIVADTVLCGLTGSATMHSAVLALTSPMGPRAHGDLNSETWENIQINRGVAAERNGEGQLELGQQQAENILRMGIYKVCWCGGDGGCVLDEHFSMHVATLIINGMMLTIVGDGWGCWHHFAHERSLRSLRLKMRAERVAASTGRVFFSETGTHMIRWLDTEEGRVYRLSGKFFPGIRGGDYQPAYDAELSTPMGLALDKDHKYLYIADFGSDRVRRIDLTKTPLNTGIIETVAGNGYRGYSGDGGPAREAQLNGPTGVAVDLRLSRRAKLLGRVAAKSR